MRERDGGEGGIPHVMAEVSLLVVVVWCTARWGSDALRGSKSHRHAPRMRPSQSCLILWLSIEQHKSRVAVRWLLLL